jgi:hypothetical protein
MIRNLVRLLLLGIIVTACTDASAPTTARAAVEVEASTLDVTLGTTQGTGGVIEWMRVTVPVAIHNTGTAVLHHWSCLVRIETRAGDGWEPVWDPICLLIATPPERILPAETLRFSMEVWAALDGPAGPDWKRDEVEGTYRLIAHLGTPATRGSMLTVESNAFTLAFAE